MIPKLLLFRSISLLLCFALLQFPNSSKAQNGTKTISGSVFDENGKGLAGVTIQVKGTNNTSVSLQDGSYKLNNVSAKDVLGFSYAGYTSQEIAVGGKSIISLSLVNAQKSLDDVVVIGYGTQKKRNVSGKISSFDASKLDERAISRVDQALVGQMAGVNVKQTTGVPGKAFSVQVRGSGSISAGNEPLYVIDGFPLAMNASNVTNGSFSTGNPLDNINPNDIESIEVLKDAAAAAIYGSRASNGVVLITTRRGKLGKPKINFNGYQGYNEASKIMPMLDGDGWIARATEIINATYVAKYGPLGATANDAPSVRQGYLGLTGSAISTGFMLDPRWSQPGHPGLAYHDFQREIEQKGQMGNYQISASGATDVVRYYISGNYTNQDGFVIGLGYKSYSARANVEINATPKLKFGINIAPTYSITQDPGVEGKDNVFHQALSMSPVQEDSVGLYPNIGKNAQYFWSNSTNGSLGKLQNNVGTTKRYRTIGTVFGEYQIIKGLTFKTSVNFDNTDNISNTYVPYITTGTQASRTFTGANNLLAAVSGSYNSYRRQTFVNENTITYNLHFEKINSNLSLLAGYAYNLERLDRTTLSSSGGYTNAAVQTLNAAAAVTGNTNSTQNVLISTFGRVQFDFKDKLLVSASLRRDGSSRFGLDNQYGIFPSASAAWRVSQEGFMQNVKAISDLKLRASYGVNGNNTLPDYGSIATLGSLGYVLGTTQAAAIGQAPNLLANPNLKWEKSQTYDFGIDFGFLRNRITVSFDYYNKLSNQLLLNVQVPEVTGFQTALQNIGSVRNIGQELEITSHNLVGKFKWNTSVNVAHNANKIVALAPGQTQIIIPNGFNVSDEILRVGSALNSVYVLKNIGFITAADLTNNVAQYGTGESVGDIKYEDFNGDGKITEADKQILGHPNPDYTFGITNSFNYKGFDLSIFVQGQTGGSIYSELGRAITRPGQGFTDNTPATYLQRWISPTQQGDGRFGKAYSTYNSPIAAGSDWLYSSDYIRVRDITFGYNMPAGIMKKFAQTARVYLTMENFFGHDKYTNGLNPEAQNTTVSSNSAYPEAGDYGALPLAKSLVVGVNITF